MQTDFSLSLLEACTTDFGQLLRQFRDMTRAAYNTLELPREAAARSKREISSRGIDKESGSQQSTPNSRKPKLLNLHTVKLHFLGDYVQQIRHYGTTDSYSTQLVHICPLPYLTYLHIYQAELEHRLVKRLYGLTNKKDAMTQIGKKYIRHHALQNEYLERCEAKLKGQLEDHHIISKSRNQCVKLFEFVLADPHNPTKKVLLRTINHLILSNGIFLELYFQATDPPS